MGFFVSLLCICMIVYLGLWIGIKSYAHFNQKFFLHHKEFVEIVALYLASFVGMGLFSFMSFIPARIVMLWGFAGLGIVSFSQSQLPTKKHLFFQFLLCFFSTFILSSFSGNILFPMLMGLSWWIMWRTIVWFDRFPLTTLLVFLGWTMALVTMGLMIHIIPTAITAIAALLGTLTFLFASYKTSQKQPVLGKNITSMLGFIWAGVWVYFLNLGAVFQTLTAFGYYLFEIGFLIIAFFCHKPFQSLLGRSLTHSQSAAKAVKSVFFHILLLSFFAVVMIRSRGATPLILFVSGILLVDLYMRLNALEHPIPTWREMFKDAQKSVLTLVNEVKSKKTIQKNNTRTASKKPIKKKPIQKRKTKK